MVYNMILTVSCAQQNTNHIKCLWLWYQEGKLFADENNLLFMETSAKAAVNVAEIFTAIGNWFSLPYLSFTL